MSNSVPVLPTVGQIAASLGVPLHRVLYVIDSRNIQPLSRAGAARVFDQQAVEKIRGEIHRMDHPDEYRPAP